MDTTEEKDMEVAPPSPTNQRTVGADKDDRPKIKVGSYGPSPGHQGGQSVTVNGFDSKEFEQFEGALHGHHWVTVSDRGRLRAIPTYRELPGPLDDEMMLPFWRPATKGIETQLELFELEQTRDFYSGTILIQSLCGYHYSHGNYRHEAEKLLRWGFDCLRSRRKDSGRFSEVWLLHMFEAQSDLKETIEKVVPPGTFDRDTEHRRLNAAISFLGSNSSFGTLDVCIQRMAMSVD